jgi:hypothetical protein
MKSQKAEALDVVEFDLRYARQYYDSWMSGGADYFQSQFREAVSWIEWNPELFHRTYKTFRRTIIRNTYFGIFYAIEPDVTTIVAVLDLRQRPSTIRKIVRSRRNA